MIDRLARWPRYALALSAHYSGLDLLYRRITGAGLVVLMLHRLREEHDPYPLSMSRRSLRELVTWLRRRHALVGLDEGLQQLGDSETARVNYAITFDDGYHDNLHLIDEDLGAVPAVVYVATDQIGGDPIWVYRLTQAVERRTRDHLDLGILGLGHFNLAESAERDRLYALLPPRLKQFKPDELHACIDSVFAQTRPVAVPDEEREMLDWEEVRRLDAHGIRIGAHTRNHVLLSRVDAATARDEIVESRAHIARELGAAPRHFAYPNGGRGDFGARDVELARVAGFRTAATSIEGVNRPNTDPFLLLRYNVHEDRFRSPSGALSAALFFSETSGLLGWLRAWRSR
jgi:peptidoglycan/xylan/chitin deacetylase (PgdA/CDA1 family)